MARRKTTEETPTDVPDIRRRRPELPLRCGDCLFLDRFQTYGAPCSKYGTVPSSVPCARFTPDPRRLGDPRDTRDVLRVLARARNQALMASAMMSGRRVRRMGFELGDVVYVHVMGGRYLSNYAAGVVTGASASQDALVISGAADFVAFVKIENVIRREQWVQIREKLVRRDAINDPAGGLRRVPTRGGRERLCAYEPPEMRARGRQSRSSFNGKRRRGPIVLSAGDAR